MYYAELHAEHVARFKLYVRALRAACNANVDFKATETIVTVVFEEYVDKVTGRFYYSKGGNEPVEYRRLRLDLDNLGITDQRKKSNGDDFEAPASPVSLLTKCYKVDVSHDALRRVPKHLEPRTETVIVENSLYEIQHRYDETPVWEKIMIDDTNTSDYTIITRRFDRAGELVFAETVYGSDI